MLIPGAALAQGGKAPDYQAIVAAPDRSDADRQTDQRRQPAKMLAFTGVTEGMKVLDMEANAGYSTELLARAVGPTGTVWAQDPASIIERFVKDKFDNRAKSDAMKNVVHVVRDFDDPIPPDVSNLDMITFFFAYHDVTYMPVDRAKMNAKMFAALKPGGIPHHRRPFRQAGRRHHGRQDAAPDRGGDAAAGDRGGRLQVRRRGRFPASSRRPPRRQGVQARRAGRRVRAEIPEAQVRPM